MLFSAIVIFSWKFTVAAKNDEKLQRKQQDLLNKTCLKLWIAADSAYHYWSVWLILIWNRTNQSWLLRAGFRAFGLAGLDAANLEFKIGPSSSHSISNCFRFDSNACWYGEVRIGVDWSKPFEEDFSPFAGCWEALSCKTQNCDVLKSDCCGFFLVPDCCWAFFQSKLIDRFRFWKFEFQTLADCLSCSIYIYYSSAPTYFAFPVWFRLFLFRFRWTQIFFWSEIAAATIGFLSERDYFFNPASSVQLCTWRANIASAPVAWFCCRCLF